MIIYRNKDNTYSAQVTIGRRVYVAEGTSSVDAELACWKLCGVMR